MSGAGILLAAVAAMLASLVGLGGWGLRRVRAGQRASDGRQGLIDLAARAAADSSGEALLTLLDTLDRRPQPDSPVQVAWLVREAARGGVQELLVTISWDGNQWRRIFVPQELETRLACRFEAGQPPAGPTAVRLHGALRDLSNPPGPG